MKNIILIFLILLTYNLNAQECGTPITTTNQVFNIPTDNDSQYCVNIKFHIVRESNGTGGFDASQITNLINYINQFYNSISINVTSIGFDYINNSALFNIDDTGNDSTEFNQLITNNNISNAINFYIVNSANYNGRAGAIISNNLVVRIDKVFAPTSPHEIGHCFNLLHTFQGTASGTSGCAENINGLNCSSCGDNVCDTPADANVGTTNGYNPDLTNIMSYYTTRDHFTQLQGTRMRNAIGGSSLLQQTLSSQCASIIGPKIICANSNYQYAFSNPQNTSVLWSVSSNIQIINFTNTEISVSTLNSTSSGQGIITANINGSQISKAIWVGKPTFNVSRASIQDEYCDSNYHYVKFVINRQPNESYAINVVPIPGMSHGWDINNRYSFRLPENYSGFLNFTVTGNNSCGSRSVFVEEEVNNCNSSLKTSLSSNNKYYRIFPNPANDIISIESKIENINPLHQTKTIGELFDLLGQSKLKVEIVNNKATFSVYGLNKGIYIFKIALENQIENHQIIVE